MKIVCNGYDLSDAVGKVIKAAGTKTVNPVLEGIKLECFDGAIKLTATDMELAIGGRSRQTFCRIRKKTRLRARRTQRLRRQQDENTLS